MELEEQREPAPAFPPEDVEKLLHLRQVAEAIIESGEVINRETDPALLPIAGLRSFELEGETITPREILPDRYRPLVIYDLDDTVWPHAEHLVRAVSEASGVHATLEELSAVGHTRNISAWKENPIVMAIHDEIVKGNHPLYYPYMNIAWQEAVNVVSANNSMGHHFCYVTGRPPELFTSTLQALQWNRLPHENQIGGSIKAAKHRVPLLGYTYCAYSEFTSVNDYKLEVVGSWLEHLRKNGWEGKLVIIDDLLSPYYPLIEAGEAVGISPKGLLNRFLGPDDQKYCVSSWSDIGQKLMDIHTEALEQDPSPWRVFDCGANLPGILLIANKSEVGTGTFDGNSPELFLVNREVWPQNQGEIWEPITVRDQNGED